MIETVKTCGYEKKLGRYGFRPNLCTSKEQCEEWLDFCKKNKMVWLGGSYGTLVHKDFRNHFEWLGGRHKEVDVQIELGIMDDTYNTVIDTNHTNILKSKINDCYLITSSPNYIEWSTIKKYPYQVFIIHPSLLEDYNLNGINIAFTNMSYEEMYTINKAIYESIGLYGAFRHLRGAYRSDD